MKSPPRFFVPPEDIRGGAVAIRGSDVDHLRRVLRLRAGDLIQVLDGGGNVYAVELCAVEKKEAVGRIMGRAQLPADSPARIFLGQALLKSGKWDDIIRKAVELGVHSISPLRAERTAARLDAAGMKKKCARWQQIAIEAAKQCGRGSVPAVAAEALTIEQFCRGHRGASLKLLLWEEERSLRLRDVLRDSAMPADAAAIIGPEGGITAAEAEAARACGFQTVTLGPRRLRAETAPLAFLAILQYRWGDLG